MPRNERKRPRGNRGGPDRTKSAHGYGNNADDASAIVEFQSKRRPQLRTQVRLFRDGQAVFTGPLLNYDVGKQTDMKRLQAGGRLALGTALTPGEYVLQVVVTDSLAKGKYRTATQWIDFEMVK